MLLSILISFGAAYMVLKQGGVVNYGVAVFIALIGAGLPIALLVSTKYVVAAEQLNINSGPFSWSVPIATITSVKETRNPLSGPALSLDRLEISYGKGQTIIISPANKAEFRAAIGW